MVQTTSFYPRREETWNFQRVPRLIGVEKVPLRAPCIEGEVWESSLPTEFKGRMSNKMNSSRFPKKPSVSKFAPLHKDTIEYASRIPKQSVLPKEETLMAIRLIRRNARNVPWIIEKTLAPVRRQSPINHVIGPRTSKSSSPSEVLDSRILRGYYGAKGPGYPSPFRMISPRAQSRRKMSEDD